MILRRLISVFLIFTILLLDIPLVFATQDHSSVHGLVDYTDPRDEDDFPISEDDDPFSSYPKDGWITPGIEFPPPSTPENETPPSTPPPGLTTRPRKPPFIRTRPRPNEPFIDEPPPEDPTPTENPPPSAPPGWPPSVPPPSNEPMVACQLHEDKIPFPHTVEYLDPPGWGQAAFSNVAVDGHNVLLHDLSHLEQVTDLYYPSVGLDFMITRTYRSSIKTQKGGYNGFNWDFNYHKRVVPEGGKLIKRGLRVESLFSPNPVMFMDGTGRGDRFRPNATQKQKIRNYDSQFEAYVTYYQPQSGLFAELERYIIISQERPWLTEHKNFEGDMFYAMRYKNGYREIYSCRGTLLYMLDRHNNVMTFEYAPTFHPLTHNPKLAKVIDTVAREYSFQWENIDEGTVNTNYQGKHITGVFPMFRLQGVVDASGRSLSYEYRRTPAGPVLEKATQLFGGAFTTQYNSQHYKGREYLSTITLPREVAKGGPPILTNHWKIEKDIKIMTGQTFGQESQTATRDQGHVGGRTNFRAKGSEKIKPKVWVTDPLGNEKEHKISDVGSSFHITSTKEKGPNGKVETKYEYNNMDLMTKIVKPEGNEIVFQYEGADIAVRLGKVLDWVEGGVTYMNNLQRGNLKQRILRRGSKKKQDVEEYDTITIRYEYEPLYNQLYRIEGPGQQVTQFDFDYFKEGYEGNPYIKTHPKRTTASGNTFQNISTKYTYEKNGLLATAEDPLGNETTYGYDLGGAVTSMSSPQGSVSYGRDGRSNATSYTDMRGAVFTFKYDGRDLITEEIQDNNRYQNKMEYQYDENRNLIEEKIEIKNNVDRPTQFSDLPENSGELKRTYEYNLVNQMSRITETSGSLSRETRFVYNGNRQLRRKISPEGFTLIQRYDALGFMKEREIAGVLETLTYDKNGNMKTHQVGDGGPMTKYETDGFDRPVYMESPTGTKLYKWLAKDGQVKSSEIHGKSANGRADVRYNKVVNTYDEFGSVIFLDEFVFVDGAHRGTRSTKYERDKTGRVLEMTGPKTGQKTTFEYNEAGQISKEIDAWGNEVRYAYESGGLVSSITEQESEVSYGINENQGVKYPRFATGRYTTVMIYDALGRLVSTTNPGGDETNHAYTSTGSLIGISSNRGRKDYYEFDGLGRKVKETQFADQPNNAVTIETDYDLLDRETSVTVKRGRATLSSSSRTYDEKGQISQMRVDRGIYRFKYDPRGNVTEETKPDGTKITSEYDGDDRLTRNSVNYVGSSGSGRSSLETYQYDAMGRIVDASLYGGQVRTKMLYDSLGNIREEEQTVKGESYKLEYHYNDWGERTSMKAPALGLDVSEQTFQYEYDILGRLTKIGRRGTFPQTQAAELEYEYSGISRLARRTLRGGIETFYYYDEARRPTGSRVFHNGSVVHRSETEYGRNRLPKQYSSVINFANDGTNYTDVTLPKYTVYDVMRRQSFTSSATDGPTQTVTNSGASRIFELENGKVQTVYSYNESKTTAPGLVWGRNQTDISTGEKTTYTYDGNKVTEVAFHRYGNFNPGITDVVRQVGSYIWNMGDTEQRDLEAGLKNETEIKNAMQGQGDLVQRNTYSYNAMGQMTEDNRFQYDYDHRGLMAYARDKYTFGRSTEFNASYYYDFLNRLVYIEYGPRGPARQAFENIRHNTRILYDGGLPYAELKTAGDGDSERVENWYVPHPEGKDIAAMRVRTYYDRRGDTGSQQRTIYPFFDHNGKLSFVYDTAINKYHKTGIALDSVVRSDAKQRHVVLHRFDSNSKPEDLFAFRPNIGRTEVPLTSLQTRWLHFPELNLHTRSGKPIHDYTKNREALTRSALDARMEHLSEIIGKYQKAGVLAIMLPLAIIFFVVSPWVMAKIVVADVWIDYIISRAILGKKYSNEDLLESIALSVAFFGMGSTLGELRHLRTVATVVNKKRKARFLKNLNKMRGAKQNREAGFDLSRTLDPDPKKVGHGMVGLVEEAYRHRDWAARVIFWRGNPVLRDLIDRQIMNIIIDAAEDGFKWAQSLFDDLVEGNVQIILQPDMAARGEHILGSKILRVSPFGRKGLEMRNIYEIASTAVHEYVHFKGWNEIKAHWVQFKFLARMLSKNPNISIPEYADVLSKLTRVLEKEGKEAGRRLVFRHVVNRLGYGRIYRYDLEGYVMHLSPFKGGRYSQVLKAVRGGEDFDQLLPWQHTL